MYQGLQDARFATALAPYHCNLGKVQSEVQGDLAQVLRSVPYWVERMVKVAAGHEAANSVAQLLFKIEPTIGTTQRST